jgi:hypothetical protein
MIAGKRLFRGSLRLIGAAGFLAASLAYPQVSQAKGAFAAGIPDDVAAKGVALGEGHNYSTRDEAEARALDECRTNKDTGDEIHALCRIVGDFDDRCLSTSLDPKAGTPGWGWAIADSQTVANDQALSMCRASAGGDRAPYCVTTQSVCDGAGVKSR